MRPTHFSDTAANQLTALLIQACRYHSVALINEKNALVFRSLRDLPELAQDIVTTGLQDDPTGLYRYSILDTPYVLYFSLSPTDIRIEIILHKNADQLAYARETADW